MRDGCEHAWWGSFRSIRVSLPRWANRNIHTKTEPQAVLDEVRTAIRAGTFDGRDQAPREVSPMTFHELADIYKERHAVGKKLSLARTIDWRIRPIRERFADSALTDIKTADIEDFIGDRRKPRIVGSTPKSVALRRPQSTAPSSCSGTCSIGRSRARFESLPPSQSLL
jgi:hypothetical protein